MAMAQPFLLNSFTLCLRWIQHNSFPVGLVAVDTTGDSNADTVLRVQQQANLNLSSQQRSEGQDLDIDGDGVADMVAVDTTGDGNFDTVVQLDAATEKVKLAQQQAVTVPPEASSVGQLVTDSVCSRMDAIHMCAGSSSEARARLDAVVDYARRALAMQPPELDDVDSTQAVQI